AATATRLSLRDYQLALSQRLQSAQAGARVASKLGLRVAGEAWLVDLVEAGEVLPVPPITPVPLAQPWFRGVANIRGNLHSVTANRILLGQAAVFSGPAAQLGIQMRNGIKTYLDYVNERGGVHGRKLELATEDDKYEASVAPIASRKLIEEHKVFALLGYVGT